MNIAWPDANVNDQLKLKSIKILLNSRPHFIPLIFSTHEPRLKRPPDEILCSASGMSHGEILLIMLSLDIWNGSGGTDLHEVIRVLDTPTWLDFLDALSAFSSN